MIAYYASAVAAAVIIVYLVALAAHAFRLARVGWHEIRRKRRLRRLQPKRRDWRGVWS